MALVDCEYAFTIVRRVGCSGLVVSYLARLVVGGGVVVVKLGVLVCFGGLLVYVLWCFVY